MKNSRMRVIVGALCLFQVIAFVVGDYGVAHCDNKTVIVQLFEWKWDDIAKECEIFLGPAGFCAVQVSPPMEHVVLPNEGYPWWQRYQVVSYKLESRSGTEEQFKSMVKICHKTGVKIIVDAVFNHMSGINMEGYGSAGTYYNSFELNFPGVPYSVYDFTPRWLCPSADGGIHNYKNAEEVRNCYLSGLTDLYQHTEYVRGKITRYLNHLVDIGVMGFRIDAAKHMWPGDLQIMQDRVKDLSVEHGFPAGARPFFYQEVIEGEAVTADQYFSLGLVTEFRYCYHIVEGIYNFNKLGGVYRPNDGMVPPGRALTFVDNHDNQRNNDNNILTYKNGREYVMAVVYTLAQDYGFTRIISSYDFYNRDQGPPGIDGKTDDVIVNANGTCNGGWNCEHRIPEIARMAQFRNKAGNTFKDHWIQYGDTVVFSRGSNGFFAMHRFGDLNMDVQTGMAPGNYCDIITNCAKTVTVRPDGTAKILIDNYNSPFLAICRDCRAVV